MPVASWPIRNFENFEELFMNMKLNRAFVVSGILSVTLLAGCASNRQALSRSTSIPAAEGEIQAKEEKNGNTHLKIKVDHLAIPAAVDSDASTYVVWAEDKDSGKLTNLGAMQVNDKKQGNMEAITPLKKFDVYITPEGQATAEQPSGERLLWASLDME
jgi:hypothetical protein